MKLTIKLFSLCFAVSSITLFAQSTQKWYADDIYFDQDEKDISYIEIVEYDDYWDEIDTLDDDYRMSYSMRINRFHRDYFGSSISFNYGYFNDPYIDFWYGYNDPFFNYWGGPFYGWGYNNWYNPWYSPWYNNFYSWYYPYNFYGCGFNAFSCYPYYLTTPGLSFSQTTVYGHRATTGSNTPHGLINRENGTNNIRSNEAILTTNKRVSEQSTSNTGYTVSQKKDFKSTKPRSRYTYTKQNNTTPNTVRQNQKRSNSRATQNRSYSQQRTTRFNSSFSSPNRSSGSSRPSFSPGRNPR